MFTWLIDNDSHLQCQWTRTVFLYCSLPAKADAQNSNILAGADVAALGNPASPGRRGNKTADLKAGSDLATTGRGALQSGERLTVRFESIFSAKVRQE
jgi:hypothetical protein